MTTRRASFRNRRVACPCGCGEVGLQPSAATIDPNTGAIRMEFAQGGRLTKAANEWDEVLEG